jgi:hypothetical protein
MSHPSDARQTERGGRRHEYRWDVHKKVWPGVGVISQPVYRMACALCRRIGRARVRERLAVAFAGAAYDQYATQAFEVAAMDYVLKTVQVDRLKDGTPSGAARKEIAS